MTFYVPLSDRGVALHLVGSLKRTHSQFRHIKTSDVEVHTLDEFGLADVRFVKADVEGSEREVLDGGRVTIARDRPIILLELLSGTHDDPAADTAAICGSFGYDAFIVQRGEKIAALSGMKSLLSVLDVKTDRILPPRKRRQVHRQLTVSTGFSFGLHQGIRIGGTGCSVLIRNFNRSRSTFTTSGSGHVNGMPTRRHP